jgi:hypothetical protein
MLTLLIISLFLICIFSFILLIILSKQKKGLLWISIGIPIILAVALSFYYTMDAIKAQPIPPYHVKVMYLDHLVLEKKWIYIWLMPQDRQYPITVVEPYTKEREKELEEAKRAKATGLMTLGELAGKDSKTGNGQGQSGNDRNDAAFVFYQFNPVHDLPPKN